MCEHHFRPMVRCSSYGGPCRVNDALADAAGAHVGVDTPLASIGCLITLLHDCAVLSLLRNVGETLFDLPGPSQYKDVHGLLSRGGIVLMRRPLVPVPSHKVPSLSVPAGVVPY